MTSGSWNLLWQIQHRRPMRLVEWRVDCSRYRDSGLDVIRERIEDWEREAGLWQGVSMETWVPTAAWWSGGHLIWLGSFGMSISIYNWSRLETPCLYDLVSKRPPPHPLPHSTDKVLTSFAAHLPSKSRNHLIPPNHNRQTLHFAPGIP
jgi:hypothetical protein